MNRARLIVATLLGVIAGVFVGTRHLDDAKTPAKISKEPTSSADARADSIGDGKSAPQARNPVTQKLLSALRDPLELRRQATIYEAVQGMQAADFLPVMAAFAELPAEFHYPLISTLIERWVRVDADSAAKWLREHPRFLGWAVAAWGKADPHGAARAALAGALGNHSEALLVAVASEFSGPEAVAHWAKLRSMPAGSQRERALVEALSIFAARHPSEAFLMADDIADGVERTRQKLEILEEWAKKDPKASLSRLTSMVADLKFGALGNLKLNQVISAIAEQDAATAIEWVSTLPSEIREGPAIAAARMWAAKEPVIALEWCLENGIEITRVHRHGFNSWQASVLGEAMTKQPNETLAWLARLDPGADRDLFIERAFADALWYLPKHQNFDEHSPVAMRLFDQLPAEAQERQAARLGKGRFEAGLRIVDLDNWTAQFTEGPVRQNAIIGILTAGFEKDASQVEPLLASVKSSSDHDAALHGLAAAMSWNEPNEAATRALQINDLSIRQEALEAVMFSWLKRDPTKGQEWLTAQGSTIPETWKQGWLETAKSGAEH